MIERRRDEVGLKVGAVGSDIDDILGLIESGHPSEASRALVSIGSDQLLRDLDIPGLFRDWLEQSRTQFERTLARAVARRMDRLEADRDWSRVRALAEAQLQRDPLDEGAVAAAMRADIALGATATAYRRFQTLQGALERDFGVSPGPMAREALALAAAPATVGFAKDGPPNTAPVQPASAPIRLIVTRFERLTGAAPEAGPGLRAIRDEVLWGLSRFTELEIVTDPRPLESLLETPIADTASAYLLSASLRTEADAPSLAVQLLAGDERRMVWSERFPVSEAGGAPDDSIARIVGAVLPIILADRARHIVPASTSLSSADAMLTLGIDASPGTYAEARAAAETLEALIANGPRAAEPLLALVYLYNTDFGQTRAGSSGPKERARALELAKAALAVDRRNGHGHTALGWCYLRGRRWEAARRHFETALTLNPFHVRRLMEIGFGLVFLDDLEQARRLLDRCLFLNPASHDDYFTDLGLVSMICGDHALAASYFDVPANPQVWGPIYAAINAVMADWPAGEAISRALEELGRVWPTDTQMTGERIVDYIAQHHPFQSEAVGRRFLAAAQKAFAQLPAHA